MNHAFFGKNMRGNMRNVRKYKKVKLITTERRGSYFVSEPNYHGIIFFLKTYQQQKREKLINKPVYLQFTIFELSKILLYQFWYDYVKPKYGEKAKLCYMDTNSFIAYIKNRWYL